MNFEIITLLVLIFINAFFAASEIALITLNDAKIKNMAEEGNKKAKKLLKLLGEPSRFLATIQIGITLAGFFASAYAAETFAEPIVNWIKGYDISVSDSFLKTMVVIVITILLSFFTLVIGELVPKRIAMKKYEKIAFFVVTPLSVLSTITYPFVKLLTFSTDFIVRLLGMNPGYEDEKVTEEEIRLMVDVGEEKGAIRRSEKDMINNIFEFNDKIAADAMTHRMEIFAISEDSTFNEIINIVEEEKYSRIPIYKETIDNIVGVLYVKDILKLLIEKNEEKFKLNKIMREPLFLPETKRIDEIFAEFKKKTTQIAVLINEYGETSGIITMEDLLEEIVGNIFDEYDENENDLIKKVADNIYEVNALVGIDEVEEKLNIKLENDEHETLNVLLIDLFRKIPKENDEIIHRGLKIKVLKALDTRIEKVLIKNKGEK